jgi:hypothetical protein
VAKARDGKEVKAVLKSLIARVSDPRPSLTALKVVLAEAAGTSEIAATLLAYLAGETDEEDAVVEGHA